MKKHRLLICVLLSLFLLVSCGTAAPSSQSASAAQADSVTFTDDLGRTVTVDSPKRVAALIGSFADVWCIAGGKDTLVAAADDTWTQFDLDLDESVTVSYTHLILTALCVLLAVCLVAAGGLCGGGMVLAAVLVFVRYRRMSQKEFGGISGDLAGWFLQKTEIWMLAALVVCQMVEEW